MKNTIRKEITIRADYLAALVCQSRDSQNHMPQKAQAQTIEAQMLLEKQGFKFGQGSNGWIFW